MCPFNDAGPLHSVLAIDHLIDVWTQDWESAIGMGPRGVGQYGRTIIILGLLLMKRRGIGYYLHYSP